MSSDLSKSTNLASHKQLFCSYEKLTHVHIVRHTHIQACCIVYSTAKIIDLHGHYLYHLILLFVEKYSWEEYITHCDKKKC